MKRLALLAVLALSGLMAFSTTTRAEDTTNAPAHRRGGPGGPGAPGGRGGEGMMKERMDKMATELNLTEDQKTKVQAIMKDTGEKMKALRDDTTTAREDKMTKAKAIRDDSNTQIKALLTDEQKTKFDAMQKENEERMKKWREGQGGEKKPAKPEDSK
ncbi:Spy/CpxP family protein refolding chaperone [Pedosphaera parvula]|nr:Spy/CpxP family protein refolding chaperone [Pedosphaera parvula]